MIASELPVRLAQSVGIKKPRHRGLKPWLRLLSTVITHVGIKKPRHRGLKLQVALTLIDARVVGIKKPRHRGLKQYC